MMEKPLAGSNLLIPKYDFHLDHLILTLARQMSPELVFLKLLLALISWPEKIVPYVYPPWEAEFALSNFPAYSFHPNVAEHVQISFFIIPSKSWV